MLIGRISDAPGDPAKLAVANVKKTIIHPAHSIGSRGQIFLCSQIIDVEQYSN